MLLERRIERELARTAVGMSADGLWAERFHLSRLQTQVETLVLSQAANRPGERISKSTGPEPGLPVFAASPIKRLAALERRRTQLADDAFDRISAGLILPAAMSRVSASCGLLLTRSAKRSHFLRICRCAPR